MKTLELVELKLQLKEMIDKGYIRPSGTPWGAPIFLWRRMIILQSSILITTNWTRWRSRTYILYQKLMTYWSSEGSSSVLEYWLEIMIVGNNTEKGANHYLQINNFFISIIRLIYATSEKGTHVCTQLFLRQPMYIQWTYDSINSSYVDLWSLHRYFIKH